MECQLHDPSFQTNPMLFSITECLHFRCIAFGFPTYCEHSVRWRAQRSSATEISFIHLKRLLERLAGTNRDANKQGGKQNNKVKMRTLIKKFVAHSGFPRTVLIQEENKNQEDSKNIFFPRIGQQIKRGTKNYSGSGKGVGAGRRRRRRR